MKGFSNNITQSFLKAWGLFQNTFLIFCKIYLSNPSPHHSYLCYVLSKVNKPELLFGRKKNNFAPDDLDSIITACLAKNQQAQRVLIKLFWSYVKSISVRYVSNAKEAEEVINDCFLKVFNNLAKYDHSRPFKAWLRTIVINTAVDHYRRNHKYTHHVDLDDIEIISLDEDVISKIAAEEILNLIQRLPPSYRMVFTLYVIDGYSHREISDLLGIKEGTSKSNLQDARRKLQLMIKNIHPQLYLAYALKTTKVNEN